MITNIATTFPVCYKIIAQSVLIQIKAMVFIQGWHLLSSASITSDHYSRAVTIKGAVFKQVIVLCCKIHFRKPTYG